MGKVEFTIDALYQEIGDRFAALGGLFGELGSPEAVRGLLENVISDDRNAFSDLGDRVDIPILGKCVWLRDIIEKVFVDKGKLVPGDCWLRQDLTPAERQLYLQIALKYASHKPTQVDPSKTPILTIDGRRLIPPGPFRDELKAKGLLTCDPDHWVHDSILTPVLGKPELVCL